MIRPSNIPTGESNLIVPAFSAGEVSPSLFGRADLKQFNYACSTLKNLFVNYRGGASSRAGLAFVGRCKQPGSASPPRDIRFQFNTNQSYALEFGDEYMRVKVNGAYVTEDSKGIAAVTQANPCVLTVVGHGYSNGDWVYIPNGGGMDQLDQQTYIIDNVTADTFSLIDIFDEPVNSLDFDAYVSGGLVARLYTLETPYAAEDLPLLKFTQSADVMTLVHNEYAPRNLTRLAVNAWVLQEITFESSIDPPASVSGSASNAGNTGYSYVVTAIDAVTGEESTRSPFLSITNSVDISRTAGSITISWAPVEGAGSYYVYKAPSANAAQVPVGSLYGYIAQALGLEYRDANISPNFTITPPLNQNPFANSPIVLVNMTNYGSGYTSVPTITITTSTGSGAVLTPVVINNQVQAVIVESGGHDYAETDTIEFSGGGGADAAGTLVLGTASGNYPGCVAFFQQRKVYANTFNNPDTYFMSQIGAFNNMDRSQIPIDSDAIIGTPWSQQVNGIQALVPMPGGLVVFTGLGAWQLSGGQVLEAITPTNQVAQAQAYNGCSSIVPPLVINYEILYVQSKGSTVRDLHYDFFQNIYTGVDLTILSTHLFQNYQILQWAWCEEPFKLIWCLRDDGALLCLTFVKDQEIFAWSRHYTEGFFVSVCTVSEPPVDALYVIVKRYVNGNWYYYSERMNNRLWRNDPEEVWCVDSGLRLAQPTPDAEIQASRATLKREISSVVVSIGGSGYTNPVLEIIDGEGTGSGATAEATVSGGAIVSVTVTSPGEGYLSPQINILDSTGTGAFLAPIIKSPVTFETDAAVFTSDNVGDVIRAGGGIAVITEFVSNTQVNANLTREIASLVPEDDDGRPAPVPSGAWTMTTPRTVISGLYHLKGKTVKIVADGGVLADQVVDENGEIELPVAASSVVAGLGYTAQLQTLYLDANDPEGTSQGQRKQINSMLVRMEATRGASFGVNQVDQSTTYDNLNVPWIRMAEMKNRGNDIFAGSAIPLFTGDWFTNINSQWDRRGQVAIEQNYPMPMNILAIIPNVVVGDD